MIKVFQTPNWSTKYTGFHVSNLQIYIFFKKSKPLSILKYILSKNILTHLAGTKQKLYKRQAIESKKCLCNSAEAVTKKKAK